MTQSPSNSSPLSEALRHLEIAEANLVKLERLWDEISSLIPSLPAFGAPPKYEDKCQSFSIFLQYLTKIDGWRPSAEPWDFDSIGQARVDLLEIGIGDIGETIALDNQIYMPGAELRQYRFLLNQKRRQITRQEMFRLIALVDNVIEEMDKELIYNDDDGLVRDVSKSSWEKLEDYIGQIDTLLGSIQRPPCWGDLIRHKRFAKYNDAIDIRDTDWPAIKKAISVAIYEGDPIPPEIEDLGNLLISNVGGHVSKRLNWGQLTPDQFERLMYILFSSTDGYENPQWLMQTTAPDRGRDLSVDRIIKDSLGGISRKRVFIQCKHWLSRSISVGNISELAAQMTLWAPPRIDVCIVATTGRFTADAVAFIEKQNQSDKALMIEMWPETHLETILAKRPDLIADFKLRDI